MIWRDVLNGNKRFITFTLIGLALGVTVMSYIIGRSILLNESPTLLTFAINHFAGYLFFILSPVEVFFVYMLRLGHSPYTLVTIAMATAMLATIINYAIGYAINRKFLGDFTSSRKYRRHERNIKKYGNAFLLLINFSPLSSPFAVLAAGVIKYSFKDTLLYAFLGFMLKYMLIVLFLN